MLGPFRRLAIASALGLALSCSPTSRIEAQAPTPHVPPDAPKLPAAEYGLPGEDPPKAFVPAHPRTVEEQKRVESLRYYAVGWRWRSVASSARRSGRSRRRWRGTRSRRRSSAA